MSPTTKTKCDFCRFWTGRSCMTTPSPTNCKAALDEYYASLRNNQNQPTKSLRPWDRKR
jgi:hypothetical protein